MELTLNSAIANFGLKAKEKLSNPAVTGQPEDQLRNPFENLLADLAKLCGLQKDAVSAVGESSLSDLKTRPDFAVTVNKALVGFIEVKAPGKGADPRKFKDQHDKAQWEKLRSLPNLIYTDGNGFSLWQNGELVGGVLRLVGDIESSGNKLEPVEGLLNLFSSFLNWEPVTPKSAQDLAHTTARLCRLLRDEVTEQLALKSEALTALAADWRQLLFPDATDERFADGYAQAVTFGLLMARAKNIKLSTGLHQVAQDLSQTSSLIGAALRLLTDNAENQETLKTSLGTLIRVLDAVNWSAISKDSADAWLYFYEEFLEVYDNELRKLTGSYYTPPEVVSGMVGLVDELLRTSRFGLANGLASSAVTLVDPATGTGTFLLGILRRIAETVKADEGEGSIKGAINDAVKRLIAFEMQLGPFAVAQLRILAEIVDLTGSLPKTQPRMFVTSTLGNPNDDGGWIPNIFGVIAKSRKDANKIKRDEPVTVVIGNPPYKVKAKGLGGWIEGETKKAQSSSPLAEWIPPAEWKLGTHAKHLRNLYVFFWRWATWKIYDHGPGSKTGIVCYITAAGFLSGPGFEKMRQYLRETCDDIWVIDCSPEGHQPGVNTRIFQGVQQPVCIVVASRSAKAKATSPAAVRFQALAPGHRDQKFQEIVALRIQSKAWVDCPSGWREPFLPASKGAWASFPKLEDFFLYDGSGVMPGRTWIIAPDVKSLEKRWEKLINAHGEEQEELFHPHLAKGKLGDRHVNRIVKDGLPGFPGTSLAVSQEKNGCLPPVRYGFRSFDRQWIIPDNRLINRPNPELWRVRSNQQIYLTAFTEETPTNGPALTFTGLIPDLHHYKGSFGGRAFPLWDDANASSANIPEELTGFLSEKYGKAVTADDIFAYIGAIAAHPAFTAKFQGDMSTPGLRIPVTADAQLFFEAAEVGRKLIWLHTFGERMIDAHNGRPAQPPRLPTARAPRIPAAGAIPESKEAMPDTIAHDGPNKRLLLGQGYIDNVEARMWNYEVSGKQVLLQWFSYRKANREKPIIGDKRPPSPLGDIQPDHWLAEYTTELLNVLNVLGGLTDLEETQAALLEKVCDGTLIHVEDLQGVIGISAASKKKEKVVQHGPGLFEEANEQDD
jgi:hypothetical protein